MLNLDSVKTRTIYSKQEIQALEAEVAIYHDLVQGKAQRSLLNRVNGLHKQLAIDDQIFLLLVRCPRPIEGVQRNRRDTDTCAT